MSLRTTDVPEPTVALQDPFAAASAAATNLAANVFNAVSDPAYRRFVNLKTANRVKIMGRIGGTLVAATKIRVQYHLGGDPAVATNDAGWQTLADSAGSHILNTLFYTPELVVPNGAQVQTCLVRAGLFSGDGVADPTMTACVLTFYGSWMFPG